jgi:single-strand DNA-binding protein
VYQSNPGLAVGDQQAAERANIMARGVNRVILIGNLGSDPEVTQISSGSTVASVNLATNDSWTDKSGSKQKRTEWHRLVFWNKLGGDRGSVSEEGLHDLL